MTYRIEIAEFQTRAWVSVGLVEQTLDQVRMYVCVVKRLYPGCHVRALELRSSETVAEV
ncbi:MAG: hypothetical protein RIQ55_268 [Pseudomonadota bacterium]|jgi:hypothetical protein